LNHPVDESGGGYAFSPDPMDEPLYYHDEKSLKEAEERIRVEFQEKKEKETQRRQMSEIKIDVPGTPIYERVKNAMGAVTITREEGDSIIEYVRGAIHDSEGLKDCKVDIVALTDKRMADYSDWIWENLDRASVGKELLPRLEWDKPGRKLFTYGDLSKRGKA
jgi:hypothetical protein